MLENRGSGRHTVILALSLTRGGSGDRITIHRIPWVNPRLAQEASSWRRDRRDRVWCRGGRKSGTTTRAALLVNILSFPFEREGLSIRVFLVRKHSFLSSPVTFSGGGGIFLATT